MQDSWIKVRSVRPYQSMNLRVDFDGCKDPAITKWAVDLALENWLQVALSCTAVVEANPNPIFTEKLY